MPANIQGCVAVLGLAAVQWTIDVENGVGVGAEREVCRIGTTIRVTECVALHKMVQLTACLDTPCVEAALEILQAQSRAREEASARARDLNGRKTQRWNENLDDAWAECHIGKYGELHARRALGDELNWGAAERDDISRACEQIPGDGQDERRRDD